MSDLRIDESNPYRPPLAALLCGANAIARRMNGTLAPGAIDHSPWSAINVVGAVVGLALLTVYIIDNNTLQEP